VVEQELISIFSKLDINEKRNQINSELEKLSLLLDTVHKHHNIQKLSRAGALTYNKATDEDMTNEKYFDLIYSNIIFLRKDILTLVNFLMKN